MKCKHIKSDGIECNANAIKDTDFCWFHSPMVDNREKQYSRYMGGKNRHIPVKIGLPEVIINDSRDVPPLLVDTIRHLRSGEIDVRLGTAIGYLSNVLLKSYEVADLEVRIIKMEKYMNENFPD
jgi:hypothetical protein